MFNALDEVNFLAPQLKKDLHDDYHVNFRTLGKDPTYSLLTMIPGGQRYVEHRSVANPKTGAKLLETLVVFNASRSEANRLRW